MSSDHIRNFCIIAHIDAGKSTLADRFLEATGTVEARKMRPQYLDRLDLERERGITIKMAPVRMSYTLNAMPYTLNLIDTPGHSDFSYEVSRALHAVEGAILLVDVTKGIQAQTLSNLRVAQKAGLTIIGAVNKIDILESQGWSHAQLDKVVHSVAELLGVPTGEIFRVSGKTGEGVSELLRIVIEKVPPPREGKGKHVHGQALIFDSLYDDHKGIIAFVRNFSGSIRSTDEVYLLAKKTKVKLKEVGYFTPELKVAPQVGEGETGYLATGLKEPDLIKIGDTVSHSAKTEPLPGYRQATPVVFISFYPDGVTKFEDLKRSLERLRLNDAALSFEPESNEVLGRGLKVGFLGQLHFDITASRLKDEFHLDFLTSFPSVAYRVRDKGKEFVIKQPADFPEKPERVFQPMIDIEILTPAAYLNNIVNLQQTFDLEVREIKNLGENLLLVGSMPLAELIRDFDDQMKSVSQGFASFSYELKDEAPAEVEKLEILVAGDVVQALTRIVAKKDLEREARQTVERLKKLLPREQFTLAIQAKAEGRIIARETLPAMRKDVTGYLYGGDRSRKMKLWKKQQRGKEKLKELASARGGSSSGGRVNVPVEVFREILKK